MTTPRTLIHAGHVIAFDGRSHRLLRDGAVVLEGDRIVHVGPRAAFRERVDETVDARDRVLTPGPDLDPRPHRGLPARPVVHRGHAAGPQF